MTDSPHSHAQATERIAADLLTLGVRRGGVLLVHSSLKSLGLVPGGPETVIRGLLTALGPAGTLLMPALSYATVTRERPVFDVLRTPANVGAIPEFFRTRSGTRRSFHPTHSVCAVGQQAEELLADHLQDSTPCGPHSPFHRLPEVGGQILMLGCGLRPNTSMHAIEEVVDPPYLFGPDITYTLILPTGSHMTKTYRSHGFTGVHQRYDRVAALLAPGDLRTGPVLAAAAHLLEAPALWKTACATLEREPLYFVETAS